MRRKDREITDFDEILKIIDACDIVRLGLSDGDTPYIVPVNFAYEVMDAKVMLYIHGAMVGRKYEILIKNPICSFEMDIPVQIECIEEKKDVTMRYQSVMGKAVAEFLEGEEKVRALDEILMARYDQTRDFNYNRRMIPQTAVIRLKVVEMTAKRNL